MPFPEELAEWQYKHVASLALGLNVSERPEQLDDGESPNAENVRITRDRVLIDTGYATFGGVVRGYPQKVYQFYVTAGTSELTLITTLTFYTWASSEWQYVSNGTDTTVTGAHAAASTNITVAASAGFLATEHVGFIMDNGYQHRTTVASIPDGTHITMTDAIPAGRSFANGAAVVEAVVLTGGLSDPPSAITLPSNDWMVFTNRQDNVQRYDGSDCVDVPNLPSTGDCKARAVSILENHLLLLNTVEGGTAYPQRVRYCDTGDPTNWSTGNAGFEDLLDSEDEIMCAHPIGPYLAIYREDSIERMEYIGTALHLFGFTPMIQGEGTVSVEGVANLGDSHIVMGSGTLYEYDGAYGLEDKGEKIFDILFAHDGEINSEYGKRVLCFFVEELDEVWIAYPSGSSTVPDKILRYNRTEGTFATRIPTNTIVGYGRYQTEASRPWNTLVGSWLEQTWKWTARKVLVSSPTIILCGEDPLQCYEYDYVSTDDNTTGITYEFDTKIYANPQTNLRFDRHEFRIRGTSVAISYSTDAGLTWTALGTSSPGANYDKISLFAQFISRSLMYRFTGTGGGFGLEWIAIRYVEEDTAY